MKHLILLLFIISIATQAASAQYSVHSVSGTVTLKKGLQTTAVTQGMSLTAADMLDLAEGAQIEIFNASNSQTYKCSQAGMTSISAIMIRARSISDNKGKSIRDNMNFSRPSSGAGHVYVESGMVKRSMATYDPEAKNIEVDPQQLSHFVINALRDPASLSPAECPASFTHARNDCGGLGFTVGNTLTTPIYFNIIKICAGNTSRISISELGQPSGSYVLLPDQTISRDHLSPLPPDERHIIVMTHFNFDIDKLIEQVEETMKSGLQHETPDSRLNVFISAI